MSVSLSSLVNSSEIVFQAKLKYSIHRFLCWKFFLKTTKLKKIKSNMDISTLEGTPLKLVDKFTYLGSSVESTEKDIETRLTKAWTAIDYIEIRPNR